MFIVLALKYYDQKPKFVASVALVLILLVCKYSFSTKLYLATQLTLYSINCLLEDAKLNYSYIFVQVLMSRKVLYSNFVFASPFGKPNFP